MELLCPGPGIELQQGEVGSADPQCLQGCGCGAELGLALLPWLWSWAGSGSCSSGAGDGEAASWMCLTEVASLSLHIPQAGLQSLWFQAASKPGWFVEVCVGDGSASLSLCKLLS